MRHQHRDRLAFAENPGDVVRRTVRIRRVGEIPISIAVAEQHAVIGDEFIVSLLGDLEATLAVCDGDLDHVAYLEVFSPRRVGVFDPEMDVFTLEARTLVRRKGSCSESRL